MFSVRKFSRPSTRLYRRPFAFFVLTVSMQLIITIMVGTSLTYSINHTKAPEGLQVWGKDLSGLTEEEAFERLVPEIPREVVYGEKVFLLDTRKSREALKEWLQNQYTPETENPINDMFNYLKRLGLRAEAPEKLSQEEILPQIENLSRLINQSGKPAKLSYVNGELLLSEGAPEIQLRIKESWEKLSQSTGGDPVPLHVESIDVHPTTAEMRAVKDKLGDYTTYFDPNFKERTNNVRLAAQAINGLLLAPGEEFSFNGTVGKRERETGYLPAFIFINNKVVLDDGGGVCQDSTTLYQAVRQDHLQILEKNTHSLPVSYVPLGQDATVAYGLLDFRFRNDTQGYLLISATTGSNWLRVRVFGVSDDKHPALIAPDGYPTKPNDWINDPK